MRAGMAAREQWVAKYKNQIVIGGSSLGEIAKLVDKHGVRDRSRQMGAFRSLSVLIELFTQRSRK